ncbi:MAG: molybdate ABC transporter substrate-binding protein [Verrucomicrobiota bacterium]
MLLTSCAEDAGKKSSITVAVASNFTATAKEIANEFETESGIEVVLISGSTGKLATQIQQGAPFDVFLSADQKAPALLLAKDHAVRETQITYAIGRLALFSRSPDFVDISRGFKESPTVQHLAIANPDLAPYGRAARETLQALNQWDHFENRLVRGESISQAWHFVESGNADVGFVAVSQLSETQREQAWIVPRELHSSIEQDAILIEDDPAARSFLEYLQSPSAQKKLQQHGYELPPPLHAE